MTGDGVGLPGGDIRREREPTVYTGHSTIYAEGESMSTSTQPTQTQGSAVSLSPGQRVLIRGQEWLITKIDANTLGNGAVTCTGISPLVRDFQATFLDDLDIIEPVDPTRTTFVPDASPNARDSHLFVESLLRATAPTGDGITVGDRAAMDSLPYQLVPARKALAQPRQRILIADAVGLGKTLEAGILMSELIERHKGRRILVITAKSMMAQFQREMWDRFTIPLVSLDSARIQQVRARIPANANPFSYYDKVIVSIDTLKRDIEYGAALDASHWDIIVIDEAQNVADRGNGRHRAQRARLAKRLASRSDTLIMLSATPHDGRRASFASLMNMLDPTALPDPEDYDAKSVEHLFVRRLKKDVSADVSGSFPERRVVREECRASRAEEEAFAYLGNLRLRMDADRHATNGALFRTLLEKGLFSSPAACIKTIDGRLGRLSKRDPGDTTGDAAKLTELRGLLERIGPRDFSRYVRLLAMLRDPGYGWNPDDTADRVVIFTERIETKNYLEQHLREDLKLPKGAIVSMDGQMSDLEQQDVVARFNDRHDPMRVLVASDVASEGLNLHRLSHRLIHFDTPWSLMVFQQRNGRIDRYGQRKRPDIRFMVIEMADKDGDGAGTDEGSKKIRGDLRILDVLRQKEDQANRDLGDPALLMGELDAEAEEAFVMRAVDRHDSAEDFAASLSMPKEDIDSVGAQESEKPKSTDDDNDGDNDGNGFNMMAFFGIDAAGQEDGDAADADEGTEPGASERETVENAAGTMETGRDDSTDLPGRARADGSLPTLMSDWEYLSQAFAVPAIERSAQVSQVTADAETQTVRVRLNPDGQLRSWLRRHVPDTAVLRDDMAEWSADRDYCDEQANGIIATMEDARWSRTQYLWPLNPIMEWVGLKATSLLYGRGVAPIVGVRAEGPASRRNRMLGPGDTIILMTGMIANGHANPVIDGWFGALYHEGEFQRLLDWPEVLKATGFRGRMVHTAPGRPKEWRYVNREGDQATPEQADIARSLLPDAVGQVRERLEGLRSSHGFHALHVIDDQLDRIDQWAKARWSWIENQPALDGMDVERREVERIKDDYISWVRHTYNPSGEPVIRVVAAFVGLGADMDDENEKGM